jgi:hypothetical protein
MNGSPVLDVAHELQARTCASTRHFIECNFSANALLEKPRQQQIADSQG